MTVNVHTAKTQLSQLIARAEEGEEIVIARNGKPAVRMVPAERQAPGEGRIPLGTLRNKLKLPEDWEKHWREMDAEIEDEMLNGAVFPGKR
jgi:prevent-host-death family protein